MAFQDRNMLLTQTGTAAGSSNDCRQVGHEECESSHVSIHFTWKLWWHFGRTRTSSPSPNSPRQIGQSVTGMLTSAAPYTAMGILWSALFLRPVEASLAAVSSGVSKGNLRPYLRAQRTIELIPNAQTKAQRRAARMITILVSKSARLENEPRVRFWVAFWVKGAGVLVPSKTQRGRWVELRCDISDQANPSHAACSLEIKSRIRASLNLNITNWLFSQLSTETSAGNPIS